MGELYTTKDVATICGIAEPTVRKYAQALEQKGHEFERANSGKDRRFSDFDIQLFGKMKTLSQDTKLPVTMLADTVIAHFKPDTLNIVAIEPVTMESVPPAEILKTMNDTIQQVAASYERNQERLLETIDRLADRLDEMTELYRQQRKKKKRWFSRKD